MTLFEKITQSQDALVEWLIHGVSKTNPAIPAALIGCTTSGSLSIWTSCSRKETADHDHVSM